MHRLACLLIVLRLCGFASITHAAEPPLAVNAYVARGHLVVTVFADTPTNAHIAVTLPPDWTADLPLVQVRTVRVARVVVWQLTPGAGLGIVRIVVKDARGNAVAATAYGEGPRPSAADPVDGLRRRVVMPLITDN